MTQKFQLRGNYYNKAFHLPPTTGPKQVEVTLKKVSPADNDLLLWHAPIDYQDIERVIESCKIGIKQLDKVNFPKRHCLIDRLVNRMTDYLDQLTEAISWETGRPLWDSKREVERTIKTIRFALAYTNEYKETNITRSEEKIFYRPLGPSLIISSFSSPCLRMVEQLVYLFLSGNPVVIKPSEENFYTTQLIFEILHTLDFPEGSINFIMGGAEMGKRLIKEKFFRGVFFTGTTEAGKKILELTYGDLNTNLNLQLGSKNTCIIDKNININNYLSKVVESAFLSSGQQATSLSVLCVHRSQLDSVISKIHDTTKKLIIDHPFDHLHGPFMGPLIHKQVMDNYLNYMGMAKREGLEEIMRGKQLERKHHGHYVSPSIHLANDFDPKSHFLSSEIFAPNLTIIPFDNIEHAINIANATDFGLIYSVFTHDHEVKVMCQKYLECGLLNINEVTTEYTCEIAFGGIKNSSNFKKVGKSMFENGLEMLSNIDHTFNEHQPYTLTGVLHE